MHKCKFCGTNCEFLPGEVVLRISSDNIDTYPVSITKYQFVEIVNPKCLYGWTNDNYAVKGHDYVCRLRGSKTNLTFPATYASLTRSKAPDEIIKEIVFKTETGMNERDDVNDFFRQNRKTNEKNRLKEKKRLAKEKKKRDSLEHGTQTKEVK